MSNYKHILAKSTENGGVSLKRHIEEVAKYAIKAAQYYGISEDIAKKGAYIHDIGKTSPQFQKKINGSKASPLEMNYRHEIASIFFLPLVEEKYWDQVIDMVIAHHKSIAKDGRELGILDLDYVYKEDVVDYHLNEFDSWKNDALGILNELGLQIKDINQEEARDAYNYVLEYCKNTKKGWSPLKGLLVGADHFASAIGEEGNNLPQLFKTPELSFYQRQHKLYPLSLIDSDKSKKHSFVKAPTGAGKTDFLLKRCTTRVFYTLPFQASINAMHSRITNDLKGVVDDVRLLHSTSRLVIEGNKIEEKVIQDKFGASIKVLTPHQLSSIVFGTRGYEAILFDIKGNDIILDEIHTYSDISQAIVLKIIEVLHSMDCRIHIGTATMSSRLEDEILKIIGKEKTQYLELSETTLDTFNRHITHKLNSFEESREIIEKAVSENKKLLIVANRVKNAQAIYEKIRKDYPKVDKLLLHSRFKRNDRKTLETKLQEEFNNMSKACIVVSTQVVEVSLDISFDVMITETAPIDSLIQRFGRINRVRNENTLGHYKPVYVIAPPENKKDCLPYSKEVLDKSYAQFSDGKLLKEKDLQSKIDRVYPDIEYPDISMDAVFSENKWRLRKLWHLPKSALLEKLDIDSVSCISESDKEDYLNGNTFQRRYMEIPVNYNSIKWKNLMQLSTGTNPFIVPDKAYEEQTGLNLDAAQPNNYDVQNQIL